MSTVHFRHLLIIMKSHDLLQCDGASWQLLPGVVPAHGVAMDTSLPWPEVLRPPANIKGTSSQVHLDDFNAIKNWQVPNLQTLSTA